MEKQFATAARDQLDGKWQQTNTWNLPEDQLIMTGTLTRTKGNGPTRCP
jgi:hypothetical protein